MKLARDIANRRRRAVLNAQRYARGFLGRRRAEKTRLHVITRIQASTAYLCVLAKRGAYVPGVNTSL